MKIQAITILYIFYVQDPGSWETIGEMEHGSGQLMAVLTLVIMSMAKNMDMV